MAGRPRSGDAPAPSQIIGRRAGTAVAVALLFANIANYAFQVVSGRALSVEDYGSLAGYLAVITVITVSTSALQTMAARTVAAGESDRSRRKVLDGLTRSALTWALLAALVVAVASPALKRLTSFDLVPVILLGAYVVPAALDSIAAGRLQGDRRFVALAGYVTSQAFGKLVVVAIALALGASVTGVLAAVIASSAVVAIAGRLASPNVGAIDTHVLGAESRRAFAAVTLFWLMISIDVPIAHARFDEHAAGVYAAGAVLGKAVLWIPVTVSQLVFPSLAGPAADEGERSATFRKAAVVIIVIAALSVLGLLLVGGPLYSLLYGDRYAGASTVAWKVGLAMLPMALVNLAMFHHLARQRGRFVAIFAAGAVGLAVGLSVVPATATAYAITLGITGVAVLAGMLVLESATGPSVPTHQEVVRR